MASQAQTIANAANAQHSTGPKTAEGKVRASQNAAKHRLATGVLVIPVEDRAAFCEFEANLATALVPAGAMELETCRQLARAAWNLRRLRQLAHAVAAESNGDPFATHEGADKLKQLTRYRATLEINFYRGLKTYRELQTRRIARDLHLYEPEKVLYPPNVEPRFYAKMPTTHGGRALILEIRGLIGRHITHRVLLDENFQPYFVAVGEPSPPHC